MECRRFIVIWIVFILVFSLISLSAGSGNEVDEEGPGNYTYSLENAGTDPELKIVTDNDVQSEENTGEDLDSKEDIGTSTDNQETDIENLEIITKESSSSDDQESLEEIQKTEFDSEEGTYNQESAEENLKIETDTEKNTGSQENLEESTGIKTETKQDTDNQENLENNQEAEKVESCSKANLESAYKATIQKEETEENPVTKTEMKTGSCEGSKNLEIVEVETEPEGEACNGITNSNSGGLEPETTVEAYSGENFAGTYENTGLTGVAQTEVSNHEIKKSTRLDKKQKSNTDLSTESQSPSTLKTEQSVLDTAGSLGLEGLEPRIREEALQAAEVVKKPSKLASFLIGLVGTLLIGITTIRGRMR